MSQLAAVSFDADAIRVVKAGLTRGSLTFERSLTFTDEEFEEFLRLDNSSGYLVSANPPDAIYETITIPPVEPKLTGRIVQTELKRLHPELGPFIAAHRVIGDIVQDGRTIRRIACCIVQQDLVSSLLEPFIRNGRPVRQIGASPWLLAQHVAQNGAELPQTLLCAYDEGERKTLLVQEQGAVLFTRQIPSEGRGWGTLDRQNVTMTLDYCFQSLRIRPGGAVAVNSEDPPPPFFPFDPGIPPGISAEVFMEHPSQIASLLYQLSAAEDLRPEQYQKALKEQDLISTAARFFAAAAIIAVIALAFQSYAIMTLTRTLNAKRPPAAGLQETMAAYRSAMEKRGAVEQQITLLNNKHAEPSLPGLLAALHLHQLPDVSIQGLALKRDKEGILLTANGTIEAVSLSGAQERFELLIRQLDKTHGLKTGSSKLEPAGKKFTVEARYTP